MLLTVDIGNTNISFGIFKDNRRIKKLDIPTKEYTLKRKHDLLSGIHIGNSIVCSVVPQVARSVIRDLKKELNSPPFIVGENIEVPLKNLYHNPRQLGQDRLVNAYAGALLFGAPLIVIDFGTAITFDVVSGQKEFMGGLILPGLRMSLNALSQKTALLPHVELSAPQALIARDTKNSILSGVVYGVALLADSVTQKIKEKIGGNAKIIATGGDARLIKRYCERIQRVDPDLTLKGLNLLYNNNNNT